MENLNKFIKLITWFILKTVWKKRFKESLYDTNKSKERALEIRYKCVFLTEKWNRLAEKFT